MINTAPLSLDDIIAEIANAHAQGLDVAAAKEAARTFRDELNAALRK